jgi:hypothetical protein
MIVEQHHQRHKAQVNAPYNISSQFWMKSCSQNGRRQDFPKHSKEAAIRDRLSGFNISDKRNINKYGR